MWTSHSTLITGNEESCCDKKEWKGYVAQPDRSFWLSDVSEYSTLYYAILQNQSCNLDTINYRTPQLVMVAANDEQPCLKPSWRDAQNMCGPLHIRVRERKREERNSKLWKTLLLQKILLLWKTLLLAFTLHPQINKKFINKNVPHFCL